MGETVSLINAHSDQDLRDVIHKSLNLIGFEIGRSIRKVIIKVNLCYYWNSSTGYTTDPKVVAGLVDYVREYCSDVEIYVAEADATAMKTAHAFKILGYEDLSEKYGVHLLNLSADTLEEKKTNVNGKEILFKVPMSLFESDLLINVPKMKTMSITYLTCAMKNIFGCIGEPKKIKYHPIINEAIVGINKIIRPHLTIVDGMVVSGYSPKRLNLIMATRDPFSADWIAAQIMGYDPSSIEYLRLAYKEGLGTPLGIRTIGEDWKKYHKMFPHINSFKLKYFNKIQLNLLSLYASITGDVIPPFLDAK